MKQKTYNTEYHREYSRMRRKKYPLEARQWGCKYRETHPGIAAKQSKAYRLRTRKECLSHYSNGRPICACCGETKLEFLGIDHVNGGGGKARKERGHGNVYASLKAQGYPLGYRVLCHNCNMSIGFYGYCPHQIKEKE